MKIRIFYICKVSWESGYVNPCRRALFVLFFVSPHIDANFFGLAIRNFVFGLPIQWITSFGHSFRFFYGFPFFGGNKSKTKSTADWCRSLLTVFLLSLLEDIRINDFAKLYLIVIKPETFANLCSRPQYKTRNGFVSPVVELKYVAILQQLGFILTSGFWNLWRIRSRIGWLLMAEEIA